MKLVFFKVTNIFSPVKNRNVQDCLTEKDSRDIEYLHQELLM